MSTLQLFTNNATTTVAVGLAPGDTSITLAAGTGSKFPTITSSNYFLATIYTLSGTQEINHEIVKVTARSGDVLTVTRAQEGTTARTWSIGAFLELRFTAGQAGLLSGVTTDGNGKIGINKPGAPSYDLDISGSLRVLSVGTSEFSGDTANASVLIGNSGGGYALQLTDDLLLDTNYLRILGRFSQSYEAERTMFQTISTNGSTNVGAMPSGSSTTASFQVFNDSTSLLNCARAFISINSTTATITTDKLGSGTYVPLAISVAGADKLTFGTDGKITAGAGTMFRADFDNATILSRFLFQTSTTNGATSLGLIPNGTSTVSRINMWNESDPTNAERGIIAFDQAFAFTAGVSGSSTTYLPMTWNTGGSTKMTLDITGNVGIGMTTPSSAVKKLHIAGVVSNISTLGSRESSLFLSNNGFNSTEQGPEILFGSEAGGATKYGAGIAFNVGGTDGTGIYGSLVFATKATTGASLGEVGRFAADGRLELAAKGIKSTVSSASGSYATHRHLECWDSNANSGQRGNALFSYKNGTHDYFGFMPLDNSGGVTTAAFYLDSYNAGASMDLFLNLAQINDSRGTRTLGYCHFLEDLEVGTLYHQGFATMGYVGVESFWFAAVNIESTSTTTHTLNLALSNYHKLNLGHSIATLTLSAPNGPTTIQVELIQDATGSRTVAWPASIKWPNTYLTADKTISTAANSRDLLILRWNETDYIANLMKGIA